MIVIEPIKSFRERTKRLVDECFINAIYKTIGPQFEGTLISFDDDLELQTDRTSCGLFCIGILCLLKQHLNNSTNNEFVHEDFQKLLHMRQANSDKTRMELFIQDRIFEYVIGLQWLHFMNSRIRRESKCSILGDVVSGITNGVQLLNKKYADAVISVENKIFGLGDDKLGRVTSSSGSKIQSSGASDATLDDGENDLQYDEEGNCILD